MPKVWNIGNTTVRNPKRIERALEVFQLEGFSGNADTNELTAKLHLKLKELEVLEFDGEASDWNGRKWRAVFYQLGFITNISYKINKEVLTPEALFGKLGIPDIKKAYEITPTGLKLLSATRVPEIEDIYTRQLACYELPNSLEGSFPEGKLKPFILFLQVLLKLQEKGLPGLTKFETGLFIQKFQNHTEELPDELVEEIIALRGKVLAASIPKKIKEVKSIYLEELAEFSGIQPGSIVGDYADTTFRYFSLSGLFTRLADTIVIRANKVDFVKALLAGEPNFIFSKGPLQYFSHFYTNQYPLPIDSKDFLLNDITKLKQNVRDSQNTILTKVSVVNAATTIETITNLRYELLEYNSQQREEDYAKEQQTYDSITNILSYLKLLNNEVIESGLTMDDKPAFFEWAVWRAFLSINDIIGEVHKCRRFQIDEDFFPRNTAPGGGADLIFEFETYVLIVEVTLTTSHRQMAVESEPVRRHTVQYVEAYPGKDIYCLFIAPEVDNNVAETFRIGVWYKQEEEAYVNIVPMTLKDFIVSYEVLLKKRYKNTEFRSLLDRCLSLRNHRAPIWKKSITKEVTTWSARLSS